MLQALTVRCLEDGASGYSVSGRLDPRSGRLAAVFRRAEPEPGMVQRVQGSGFRVEGLGFISFRV